MCNLVTLPYRLSLCSFRSALMRSSDNFDSFSRLYSGKNTSLCEEVEDKYLQTTCRRLLNVLKHTRKPDEVVMKCPILHKDDKKTILKFMSLLHIPPGVNFDKTKEVLDWWLKLKAAEEYQDQAYDAERVRLHGPDSAATHFFIDRQASVRLKDSNEWIIGGRPTLKCCVSGYFVQAERGEKDYQVEAIDCTNFHNSGIRYEGLKYLSGLKYLKKLILNNQSFIDAFCLDRIAGQNGKTLEYLDLTNCSLDQGCLVALYKMEALKKLVVTKPTNNSDLLSDLLLMERNKPGLRIQMVENTRRSEQLSTKSRVSETPPPIAALKQPFK